MVAIPRFSVARTLFSLFLGQLRRDALGPCLVIRLNQGGQALGQRGAHVTRAGHGHPDWQFQHLQLAAQRLGDRNHRMLVSAVATAKRHRRKSGDRPDVDHVSGTDLDHMRQERLDPVHRFTQRVASPAGRFATTIGRARRYR